MKSVVMCGSNKFGKEIRAFAKKLRAFGVVVFEPNLYQASGGKWEELAPFGQSYLAMGLTHDHFYKMRMADVVFIFNKGGYVGNSVTMEIGYAVALNKPIYALSDKDPELCRAVLFSGMCKTPEALAEKLR